MKIARSIVLILVAFLPFASHAQMSNAARSLKILPAPKEVRMGEGQIVIKPSTTILISSSEDRLAAETLQWEIRERTGMNLRIESISAAPKTVEHISLGRLTEHGLRSYL
ncbi:MAG: glycoside hydrolase family 20 zincin-like fold domain-containing protein, partial [Terriglobales bacterium]